VALLVCKESERKEIKNTIVSAQSLRCGLNSNARTTDLDAQVVVAELARNRHGQRHQPAVDRQEPRAPGRVATWAQVHQDKMKREKEL